MHFLVGGWVGGGRERVTKRGTDKKRDMRRDIGNKQRDRGEIIIGMNNSKSERC